MENFPKERDKKLYEKLHIAHQDIEFARRCAELIAKKGWHYEPWEKRGSIYFQQSVFMTSLVVSYARAFNTSKGWPRLPERLLRYSQEEKTLHNKLLRLRDSVYAHSDSTSYSITPHRSGAFETVISHDPTLKLTQDEAKQFLDMTQKALSAITSRLKELFPQVVE